MTEVVFITGFPSLRARRLAEVVLEEEETQVWLLAAPDELAEAAAVVDAWSQRSRVRVLEGDPTGLDFGLSGAEYNELARSVTLVHHLGGLGRYRAGKKHDPVRGNLAGAQEAIELGRSAGSQLERIVHHSTAFVSGDRAGTVYEDELDRGQGFHGLEQQAMFRAEVLLRREMSRLPIAVVRPTMLVGDSETGAVERLDGPYLLVMFALGLPGGMALPRPSSDNPLDIVPVDYAMRAAHRIGRAEGSAGKTFHVTSGEDLTADRVLSLVAEAGGRRTTQGRYFPTGAAEVLMRTPGLDRIMGDARTFLQQLGSPAHYDSRNTDRVLGPSGLSCPPLASYVDSWVHTVQRVTADASLREDDSR